MVGRPESDSLSDDREEIELHHFPDQVPTYAFGLDIQKRVGLRSGFAAASWWIGEPGGCDFAAVGAGLGKRLGCGWAGMRQSPRPSLLYQSLLHAEITNYLKIITRVMHSRI